MRCLAGLAAAWLIAACDNTTFSDCAVACSAATGCPDGLTCGREGLCRIDGISASCSDIIRIDAPPSCQPRAEVCDNNADDDCDGRVDCGDSDCSGTGACPTCAVVTRSLPQPVLIPDGSGMYTSTVAVDAFGPTRTMTAAADIVSVCATIEHSWARDLSLELTGPGGQKVALQSFLGQTGSEVFLGTPVDSDDTTPVAGTGAAYCWTVGATRPPLLTYAMQNSLRDLPAGNYQPAQPLSMLIGTPLDGTWTLKATDQWNLDNGFLFSWTLAFDPALADDCR